MSNTSMAHWLAALAQRLLPPSRREWGEAMVRELEEVDGGERLAFAAGMVWAAMRVGLGAMEPAPFMRLGVAFVTSLYAGFFLVNGLMGLLMVPASRIEQYVFQVTFAVGMGVTHMAAAIFLALGRPRFFAASVGAALIPVAQLVSTYAFLPVGRTPGFEVLWPLAPLGLLAAVGGLLLFVEQRRAERLFAALLWTCRVAAALVTLAIAAGHLSAGVAALGSDMPAARLVYYWGTGIALLPAAICLLWWRRRIFLSAYAVAIASSAFLIISYLQTMPEFRGARVIFVATVFQYSPLMVLGAAALVVARQERSSAVA